MRRVSILLTVLAVIAHVSTGQADPVRIDYMLNCQGCHLPGGEGFPERGVPRLRGEMAAFLGVEGGRAYLVQVPGVALSDLPDDRLARVLNWMLTHFDPDGLPTGFVPYTAQELSILRRDPLTQVTPVREALIARIRAAGREQQETAPSKRRGGEAEP